MKRMIHASQRTDVVDKYMDQCVRNIANYFYDNEALETDDARSDYYVENICNDIEVKLCKQKLEDALLNARVRQLGYHL